MGDPKDKVAYATAVEVDAIRRTVDQLIKKHDQTTSELQANMDKILLFMQSTQIQQQQLPEDKGSTMKGKDQSPHTPVVQQHPHTSNPHPSLQVRPEAQPPPKQFVGQPYTEKPQFLYPDSMRNSRLGYYHQQSNPYWHTQTQYGGVEYYDTETYDPDQEWEQHPWNINDQEEPFRPKFHHEPYMRDNAYGGYQRERNFHTNHNQNNHQYQLQQQHRAVARGPKLYFPEFSGEDTDGWIRKAEKYFEMVGVPPEDRVKVAVLYVNGKAEYWWRGTGKNA